MKKSEMREALRDFLIKPKKKFDRITWLIEKGLVLVTDSMLWVGAFITNHVHTVILAHVVVFVLLGILYINAKGR